MEGRSSWVYKEEIWWVFIFCYLFWCEFFLLVDIFTLVPYVLLKYSAINICELQVLADSLQDLYSPRSAAVDLLLVLLAKCEKCCFQKFIHFIGETFRRYDIDASYAAIIILSHMKDLCIDNFLEPGIMRHLLKLNRTLWNMVLFTLLGYYPVYWSRWSHINLN